MRWDFEAELRRFGPAGVGPHPAVPGRGPTPAESRKYCEYVAKSHYENFTVASVLLPRPLLPHFYAVYAYCRWADDLADETSGGDESLALLRWWREELHSAYAGEPRHPVLTALAETVREFEIPKDPFLNLLAAFEQDQRVKRYDTFDQLLAYCRNSANPVGELVLHLFRAADAENVRLSDEICTGLQLANFWQDVARDYRIGRVYLPREDCDRFGISEAAFAAGRFTPAFGELLRFEVDRTRGFFESGRPLLSRLPRPAKLDVELFLRGGTATLDAIAAQNFDVWTRRPTVPKWRKGLLLFRAVVSQLRP